MKRKLVCFFLLSSFTVGLAAASDVSLWGFNFYPYADRGSSCNVISSGTIDANGISNLAIEMRGSIGTKERYPYAGVVGEPVVRAGINRVKGAKGISFYVQSLSDEERNYWFKLKFSTVSDDDHYGKQFRAFKQPSRVMINFTDKEMNQGGWGKKVPFDMTKAIGDFIIQTVDDSAAYSYAIRIWGLELIE